MRYLSGEMSEESNHIRMNRKLRKPKRCLAAENFQIKNFQEKKGAGNDHGNSKTWKNRNSNE